MKKLFYTDVQACWGTLFFDEEANIVGYIHENDGNYRPEYMGFIAEFFDGKVIRIDLSKVEDKLGDDIDQDEFAETYRAEILKVIKKAAKK